MTSFLRFGTFGSGCHVCRTYEYNSLTQDDSRRNVVLHKFCRVCDVTHFSSLTWSRQGLRLRSLTLVIWYSPSSTPTSMFKRPSHMSLQARMPSSRSLRPCSNRLAFKTSWWENKNLESHPFFLGPSPSFLTPFVSVFINPAGSLGKA